MSYVLVMDECLYEYHTACPRSENIPDEVPGEFVCGGGHCVCYCHNTKSSKDDKFYRSIYDQSMEIRRKRDESPLR